MATAAVDDDPRQPTHRAAHRSLLNVAPRSTCRVADMAKAAADANVRIKELNVEADQAITKEQVAEMEGEKQRDLAKDTLKRKKQLEEKQAKKAPSKK